MPRARSRARSGQRLRELQVGSPVKLELAHAHPCSGRLAAEAIVEELERRFAGRHAHGHWYRLEAAARRCRTQRRWPLPEQAAAARALAGGEQARREAAFNPRCVTSSKAG